MIPSKPVRNFGSVILHNSNGFCMHKSGGLLTRQWAVHCAENVKGEGERQAFISIDSGFDSIAGPWWSKPARGEV
jgi:hypothetical protein